MRAILVIITVFSVPLGMMASGHDVLFGLGWFAVFAAGGGSLGYLLGGWKHAILGIGFGLYVALLFLFRLQAWREIS